MEKFFYYSGAVDYFEITDYALRTYPAIDYLWNLPFADGMEVLAAGRKRDQEEHLYSAWVSLYPFMSNKNFVSFEDFRNQSMGIAEAHARPMELKDILEQTKRIIDATNDEVNE